jgi:hypothetical protein
MSSEAKHTSAEALKSPADARAGSIYACLPSLIAGNASHAVTSLLVKEFHDIAVAYLRVANSSVRGLLGRMNMSPDDAAYDAIADLFARNTDDSFPVLARWWKKLPTSCRSSAEEIALAVRRLVVGAIHQRIFGMYRDSDPHLAKILRNVKLTLKKHPTVKPAVIGRDNVLVHRSTKALRQDQPPMPYELLLPGVFDLLAPGAGLKEILDAIGTALLEFDGYRRYVSLVEAAVIVRDVYAAETRLRSPSLPADSLTAGEIEELIESTLKEKREALFGKYQVRGVLSMQESSMYATAVGDILRRECLEDGTDESNFVILAKYIPTLTEEQYKKRHRSILEYLVRKATLMLRARMENQEI